MYVFGKFYFVYLVFDFLLPVEPIIFSDFYLINLDAFSLGSILLQFTYSAPLILFL